MSNAVEYLYGPDVALADAFARKKGWRPSGRAAWLKRRHHSLFHLPKGTARCRARWRQGSQSRLPAWLTKLHSQSGFADL
jgi:hypothetical protein